MKIAKKLKVITCEKRYYKYKRFFQICALMLFL